MGGDVNVHCDCKVLLDFCTYVMLRSLGRGGGVGGMLTFIATARFSWTSAHTSCYVPLGGVGGWGGC